MNVLIVSDWFPPDWSSGGAVISTWNLALALARTGIATTVVTTDAHAESPGSVPHERAEAGMRIVTARVLRVMGEPAHRYGLAPHIPLDLWREAASADVCVMQGLWTLPVAAASRICRLRGLPYVVSAKGALESDALVQKAFKKRVYRRLVAGGTIQRAGAVHFASERERDRSQAALGSANGVVIPNGFESRPLAPRRRAELCASLGIPEDALIVAMAGRIHPRKGFDTIVPALARAGECTHLLIAGPDHEKHLPEVMRLAASSGVGGRVHALGPLGPSELDRLYAAIDVLAVPSHWESFGNVVVEALRQGTPALISDQVPLGPYVETNRLGEVVPARDREAWSAVLERWARSPRRLDREATAALIARDYALDVLAERWLALLGPLARRKAPRATTRSAPDGRRP